MKQFAKQPSSLHSTSLAKVGSGSQMEMANPEVQIEARETQKRAGSFLPSPTCGILDAKQKLILLSSPPNPSRQAC